MLWEIYTCMNSCPMRNFKILSNFVYFGTDTETLTLTLKRVYFDNNEYCNLRKKKKILKYI